MRSFLKGPLLRVIPVLLLGSLTGCGERALPIHTVAIHADTTHARRETMSELRAAWRAREVPADTRGKKAELRFLVRLATAVRKFEHTESYGDICRLWNECLKDHLARFPESAG